MGTHLVQSFLAAGGRPALIPSHRIGGRRTAPHRTEVPHLLTGKLTGSGKTKKPLQAEVAAIASVAAATRRLGADGPTEFT